MSRILLSVRVFPQCRRTYIAALCLATTFTFGAAAQAALSILGTEVEVRPGGVASAHRPLSQEQSSSPPARRVDWAKEQPSYISGTPPKYPALAAMAHIEGVVRVRFVVGHDGTTKDLHVVSASHPLLIQAALDSVKTWRFRPVEADGTSPEVETIAPVGFFAPGHNPTTYLAPYYKEAEKNPGDRKVETSLGLALLTVGDINDAITLLQKITSQNPNDAKAHFALADAFAAKPDDDAAIEEYRRGIAINPKDKDAHFHLSESLENKGDLAGAVDEFQIVLNLAPKDDIDHLNFAQLLRKKGDTDRAITEYQKAMRSGFDLPDAHYGLGCALEQKGDLAGAEKEYAKAAKSDPNNQEYSAARDRLAAKNKG